ncbi:MAG: hypothetical protein IKE59_00100, partial [Erysipelotrichaceae bacterium]|nr:hypothetical protein [Erysipelotrichaceae bacterium]
AEALSAALRMVNLFSSVRAKNLSNSFPPFYKNNRFGYSEYSTNNRIGQAVGSQRNFSSPYM